MVKVEIAHSRTAGAHAGGWGERPAAVRLPVLGLALLGTWAGVAGAALQPQAPAAAPVHAFNFSYQSQGARAAAPTQIFDDGQHTYMQFNALDRVPELWTDDGSGSRGGRRIGFHLESPYVVIDQVLPRMRLVIDGQDTVLVNQAWKAPKLAPRPPVAKPPAPRIWTDNTPFGPEEPPGPVASDREAKPSQDARHDRGTAPASAPEGRSAFAVSEDDDSDADAARKRDGQEPPRDVDEANRRLAGKPLLTSQMLGDSELEAMRVQAMDMIARAHLAGDTALENRLRRIFRDVAMAGLEPPPDRSAAATRKRDARLHRGPMLALADTRPRSDVPLREDADSAVARGAGPAGADSGLRSGQGGADPSGRGGWTPAAPGTGEPRQAAGAQAGGAHPAASPEPVTPRSENLVFEVRDNQRLSQALGQFLETLGWRLEWESQSDFVVRRGYVVKASTLKQILLQTLGEYRLSAVLYSGNLVVAVTGGDR